MNQNKSSRSHGHDVTQCHRDPPSLQGVKSLVLYFPGENGEFELLSGQSAVRQPGSVYISSGGSGGSRGGGLHSGSHRAHHSPYIQVNTQGFMQ